MGKFVDTIVYWFKYRAIPWYTSLGLTKNTVTVEVPGRLSGKPIRVSLTTVSYAGSRYVVSLYDQSQWVKNVRAAQGRVVLLSGSRKPVRLAEIPVTARAPILLGYVQQRAFSHSGAESARIFFGLDPNPTLRQMEAIADRYPVFRIEAPA
jgi:hypothetical protein